MPYVDTSLLVGYYCPEAKSALFQRILKSIKDLIISPLVEVEFCSAVAAKVRIAELDVAGARRILGHFQNHIALGSYESVPILPAAFITARDWIANMTTALRPADAIHLATASVNDLKLLTADKALDKAANLLGVPCELIG